VNPLFSSFGRSLRSRVLARLLFLCFLLLSLGLWPESARASDLPDSLRDLVIHPAQREVMELELAGSAFQALHPFCELPYLLWPARDGAPAPFAREHGAVEAWIASVGAELGHHDFVARYAETLDWRGNEVWAFQLEREGVPLRDGRVLVHWSAERFVGFVNALPGLIVSIDEPGDLRAAESDLVYWPVRRDGRCRLVPARVLVERTPEHTRRTFVGREREVLGTEVTQDEAPQGPPRAFLFTEYPVPVGYFPDQISLDSQGKVWFSQPNNDLITRFDPITASFQQFPAPSGASGPDGLVVDSQDRVWTGMYYSGHLGAYSIASGVFQAWSAPYSGARMAIPLEASSGSIWVTDHERNRLSEFDPATSTWLGSHVMPTPSCWVVAGDEDPTKHVMYFTEYNANKLARVPVGHPGLEVAGGPITDIPVPGAGVAFLAWSNGKVYYSQWSAARLGCYDVASGQTVEYNHPVAGEVGGPMFAAPTGDVVVGSRNLGYIFVFHVGSSTWSSYQIPTPYPGLKDGLTVARDGAIWFTESGANKIARLVTP